MTKPIISFTSRSAVAAIAIGLGGLASSGMAQTAGNWPEKQMRILVGAPAGGSADILARAVGDAVAGGVAWLGEGRDREREREQDFEGPEDGANTLCSHERTGSGRTGVKNLDGHRGNK